MSSNYFVKANILKVQKSIPYLSFILCCINFYSCTYDSLENQSCNAPIPDSISLNRDVVPIFTTYCNDQGCHSGSSPGGKLNLEASRAYDELSKPGTGYINTTIPTHSILYSQLISSSLPMPPSSKLDQCDIDIILKWIQQGAKNN